MRELRDKIRFAPTSSQKKVYIIDEVHMLTKEAFNALLKTLEEPPAHAVFILATTELHKVPVTIASRCQVFQFKKARYTDLIQRLETVAKAEGLTIDASGLAFIARLAGGSYRDALSLLDQISGQPQDGPITLTTIQDVLGLASAERLLGILEAVVQGDREATLAQLSALERDGLDPEQFANQLIEAGRTLLHLSLGAAVETAEGEAERWERLAKNFTTAEILQFIERVTSHRQLMKHSVVPLLPLEVALVATIEDRRQKTEDGGTGDRSLKSEVGKDDGGEPKNQEKKQENKPVTSELQTELPAPPTAADLDVSQNNEGVSLESLSPVSSLQSPNNKTWDVLLERIRDQNMSVHGLLQQAEFGGIDGNRLLIRVPYKFAADRLSDRKHRTLVEQVAGEIHGAALVLHCEVCVTPNHVDHSPNEVTVSPELFEAAAEVFGIEEVNN
jgi:DNA polymerase-3 subunit gamma/tau